MSRPSTRCSTSSRQSIWRQGGLVELAKDVGAFQVAGGYIIGGVNKHGVPDGSMDGCDTRLFDEANLTPSSCLPARAADDPLARRNWKEHIVVIIYIAPHPDGYAAFKADGQYERRGKNGEVTVAFREGEILWRDGTRSVRISSADYARSSSSRCGRKADWIEEQQDLRRREREEVEAGHAARDLAQAPLGTMNLGLSGDELRLGVLELVRAGDTVALLWLLNDARPRAQSAIDRDEIDTELADLLDKLAAIATSASNTSRTNSSTGSSGSSGRSTRCRLASTTTAASDTAHTSTRRRRRRGSFLRCSSGFTGRRPGRAPQEVGSRTPADAPTPRPHR